VHSRAIYEMQDAATQPETRIQRPDVVELILNPRRIQWNIRKFVPTANRANQNSR